MVKAWVGQPADEQGNALPCARCSRAAVMIVGEGPYSGKKGEPRCSWHLGNGLGGEGLQIVRSARRSRARDENGEALPRKPRTKRAPKGKPQ